MKNVTKVVKKLEKQECLVKLGENYLYKVYNKSQTMKYSILLLVPLPFFGCKKDELPFDVSEGTRLVKQEFYLQGTTLYEEPDILERFYYNDDGKLYKMEVYIEDLFEPSMKAEKQFDELGNLSLIKFFANKGEDNMTLISFNEIYANP